MRSHHLATVLLLLAACGPTLPPARPLPAPKDSKAIVDDKDSAEDVQTAEYFYDATSKRDPFSDPTKKSEGPKTPVAGPKCDGPLSKFALDALRLQLTIIGDSQPVALVIDPTGRSNTAHIGDCIGTNGGRIHAIKRDVLEVLERIEDPNTGRVFPVYLPLKMSIQDKDSVVNDLVEEAKGAGR